MESFHEAWDLICDYCKAHITDVAYKTWISRIEPVKLDFDAGDAILMVPNEFHRQTLNRCYMPLLNSAVHEIFGSGINIIFTIPNEAGEKKAAPNDNLAIDSEYEFTFDTYIVGSSNKFAHAASLAVAANPAGAYNPLFIYGNSGLGKTHLLYAICNEIRKNSPAANILFTKGEYMANELIEAIQKGQTMEFRAKYRQVDVLLIDDIQFISGKVSTQEEFFHTFDALHQANKQIVLTSDRPPREIATLEERLRTRFEMGLLADIQPPDLETRIAIIRRKAQLLDIPITDDIAEYIAGQLKSNVRQLEGAVKCMRAQYLLAGEQPTLVTAQNAIRDIRNDSQPVPITVERIINEVARTMTVTPEDIRSTKRSAPISQARQVAAYVVRSITGLPMKAIGEEFGTRDHSTIVYAIQKVESRMAKDSSFKGMVGDIIKNISEK